MGSLARFDLSLLKRCYGVNTLFETGTGHGASVQWASKCRFDNITSIEEDLETLEVSRKTLEGISGLSLMHGDSLSLIKTIPPCGSTSRLIFLDANFVGGVDFKDLNARIASVSHHRSFPLLDEIDTLINNDIKNDWLIIDDARLYYDEDFDSGTCPEWARRYCQVFCVNFLFFKKWQISRLKKPLINNIYLY